MWYEPGGEAFNPGNYYYVGGATKLYGAVLIRYRAQDFRPIQYAEGATPGWPFDYDELEPWYSRAEALYQVRGRLGEDPTEPRHSNDYAFPPVPDEPAIADVRERLTRAGMHPFSLPLGVDIDRWLARAKTPWDAFPDTGAGKMDAESCGLASALAHDNVTLETGARVTRLETDPAGKRITALIYEKNGETVRIAPRLVVLAAGAVNSALLLLASANGAMPRGLANRADQVGRHFMNHNCSAALAIHPLRRNDSIYQKTIGCNDFYLDDGRGGPPLGNVQLLGKISGAILKSQLRRVPEAALDLLANRAVDFYLMSEDLPSPESRVWLDGSRIVLDWRASNMAAQNGPHRAHARGAARGGISHRADQAVRPAHALASMRHGPHGRGSGQGRRRSRLPRLRPREPVHRRCQRAADLGGGQSGADRGGAGAAGRGLCARSELKA